MNLNRRTRLLIEPPSVATGDIAFNLIVFFLVCASSSSSNTGRRQDIPRAEQKQDAREQAKPVEVRLTRGSIILNGNVVAPEQLEERLIAVIREKEGSGREIADLPEASRIVVVSTKDNKDTPYHHWINVTNAITHIGAIVTLQLEEDREVTTD